MNHFHLWDKSRFKKARALKLATPLNTHRYHSSRVELGSVIHTEQKERAWKSLANLRDIKSFNVLSHDPLESVATDKCSQAPYRPPTITSNKTPQHVNYTLKGPSSPVRLRRWSSASVAAGRPANAGARLLLRHTFFYCGSPEFSVLKTCFIQHVNKIKNLILKKCHIVFILNVETEFRE